MLACAAMVLLALVPVLTLGLPAGGQVHDLPGPEGGAMVEFPLNRPCVVTVDPRAESKREVVGQGNKISGFAAPDTAEGILVQMDSEWLVLRDGSYESWIPRSKVLLIRVSR